MQTLQKWALEPPVPLTGSGKTLRDVSRRLRVRGACVAAPKSFSPAC